MIKNLSHRKGANSGMKTVKYFIAAEPYIDPGFRVGDRVFYLII